MKGTIRLLYITTHFPPDFNYGGVVESGFQMYDNLRSYYGENLKGICTSRNPNVEFGKKYNIEIFRSTFFHSWGFSISLLFALPRVIRRAKVVYINGIVTFPNTIAAILCIVLRKKYLIALRGGIEPWRLKEKWLKKLVYYYFFVYPILRRARFVHATSSIEMKNLYNRQIFTGFVVSNGVNSRDYNFSRRSLRHFERRPFRFLFFSRISKEKGVDILIEAYKRFSGLESCSSHELVIAGPDEGNYLEQFDISSMRGQVKILGGIYGVDKVALYHTAHAFILPSYSENFGNVIAEAMASGLPVITTEGTPWEEIGTKNCGWYIEPTVSKLIDAMQEAYNLSPSSLYEKSKNCNSLVSSKYSWDSKCKELMVFLNNV